MTKERSRIPRLNELDVRPPPALREHACVDLPLAATQPSGGAVNEKWLDVFATHNIESLQKLPTPVDKSRLCRLPRIGLQP